MVSPGKHSFHAPYAIVKGTLPRSLSGRLRAWGTAFITPFRFAIATGHFRSSLASKAIGRRGNALPWYTYSMIDFMSQRDFTGMTVLEFGGGQSTLWWAARATSVLTIDENEEWFDSLKLLAPENVSLHHVPVDRETRSISEIRRIVEASDQKPFDVIIIDGHLRPELFEMAFDYLAKDGAIIFDNSEGYRCWEISRQRNCRRVDFYGFPPGVSMRSCTSLIWVDDCFMIDPKAEIADPEHAS